MLAPVIGRPASSSQYMLWRYSSSATVAFDIRKDASPTCPSPLSPPIKPQLARSAKELPTEDGWCFEPKWDGFRTIVFKDGDDIKLQSRGGKPMNRYFPDVVEQVAQLPAERVVLDGEMIVVVDGIQEFDLLSQRIHPAKSRVEMLASKTPAAFVAFDLLALDDEVLLELPYAERRERLEPVVAEPVQLTPMTDDAEAAGTWLTGNSEGAIAKRADAALPAGRAHRACSRSSGCAPPTPW